jgi:bifunctional non-homologous end joining protein LigD
MATLQDLQNSPRKLAQLRPDDSNSFPINTDRLQPLGVPIKAHFHRLFAVKKHSATHLHYDLRLELNGVMKSWALTTGPSYYPGDASEAVQMPDHSKESIDFEGLIPEPRYGAGIIMQWDCGVWAPQPEYLDVDAALRNGYLGLTLDGSKLKGNWELIRIKNDEQKPVWIFVKAADSFARSAQGKSILDEAPNSVLTGKSLKEIKWDWNNPKSEDNLAPTLF